MGATPAPGRSGTVDFVGQRVSELTYQVLIAVFSAVAFVAGYWQQCVSCYFSTDVSEAPYL